MKIHVRVEADTLAPIEILGTEDGVQLEQPFKGTWNPAGLLRLSAALHGVALTMMAKASE
jgi:hypothetical protein